MGETAPAPQEQAPDTPTPEIQVEQTQETPAAPTAQDILSKLDITKLSDEQLADLESGDPAKLAALLGEPTPEPEPKKLAEAAPEQKGEEAPSDGVRAPDRISMKAIKDAKERTTLIDIMQSLKNGEFENFTEAAAHYLNIKPPAEAAPETPAAPTPEQVAAITSPEIEAIEAEIAKLQAEYKHARDVEFDAEKQEALTEKIAGALADLKYTRRVEAEKAQAQAFFDAQEDISIAAAREKYAAFYTDPDSPFQDLVHAEALRLERLEDPIFKTPDWPEKIADRVFERHKKTLQGDGQAAPEVEPEVQIPPAPQKGVRFPGSPVGGGANTSVMSAQAAAQELESLSPEEQKAVLELLDKPRA